MDLTPEANVKKNNVIFSIVGFSLASWITTLLGLVVVPISTRLLAPDVLGKINLFNSIIMVIYHLFCLGLDHGYIRLYNDINNENRTGLWKVSVILSAITTFLTLLVVSVFKDRVSLYLVGDIYSIIVLYLAISVLSLSIERFLLIDYRVTNKPMQYTIVSLAFTIANKVVFMLPAIFGFVDYKSALTITAVFNIILICSTLFIVRSKFRVKKVLKLKKTVFESFSFGWPIMLVVVIVQFMQNIPKFYLVNNFGYEKVGLYGQAITIASIVTIAQSGFSLVWTPHVYANYKNDDGELDKLHKYAILIITIVATMLIVLQHQIILFLGDDYRNITHFLPILVLSPVLSMLGEITGIGINIKKRTRVHIFYNGVGICITLISCHFLIPVYAEIGAAISSLIGAFTIFALRTILAKKMYTPIKSYRYIAFTVIFLFILSAINCYFNKNKFIAILSSTVLLMFWLFLFVREIIDLFKIAKLYVNRYIKN